MAAADFSQFLRSQNPFTSLQSVGVGPNRLTQVAPSYPNLLAGVNWQNAMRANQAAYEANAKANYPTLFNPATVKPGTTGNFGASLDLLRTTKNPTIQAQLDEYLRQVGSLTGDPTYTVSSVVKDQATKNLLDSATKDIQGLGSYDPNRNDFTLRSNIKSEPIAQRIEESLTQFDTDKVASRGDVEGYAKDITGSQGAVDEATKRDTSAIAGFYGSESDPNSVLGRLKNVADNFSRGLRMASRRGLDEANRNANLRLSDRGLGSYALQANMDTAANYAAQDAIRRGELDRANLVYTLEGQKALAGLENRLRNEAAARRLLPADARTRLAGSELGQLGQLGQLTNLNTQYTLDSPDAFLARKLGLIGQQQGIGAQNRFDVLNSPEDTIARRLGLTNSVLQSDQLNNFLGLGGNAPGFSPPRISPYPDQSYPDYPPGAYYPEGSPPGTYQNAAPPNLLRRGPQTYAPATVPDPYYGPGGYGPPPGTVTTPFGSSYFGPGLGSGTASSGWPAPSGVAGSSFDIGPAVDTRPYYGPGLGPPEEGYWSGEPRPLFGPGY